MRDTEALRAALTSNSTGSNVAWAWRIIKRARAGEQLPYISIKMAREALGQELAREEEAELKAAMERVAGLMQEPQT